MEQGPRRPCCQQAYRTPRPSFCLHRRKQEPNRNRTETALLEAKLFDVNAEIARLEAEIQDFQTRYGILTVEQLATEQITALAQARSQLILKELEISTYAEFSRIDDPVLRRLRAERDSLRQLIDNLERGSGTLGRPGSDQLPQLALQYARLERDMRVQTEIFRILTQQYELAKLQSDGEPSKISLPNAMIIWKEPMQ